MPGVNVKINYDKCVGCGACTKDVCFVDATHMVNGEPVITYDCKGFGSCVEICPQKLSNYILKINCS
ncbi:MAG: 4Fe-4S dicluster domain-containing protein [Candidatus Baldrarchaeia archaeon]